MRGRHAKTGGHHRRGARRRSASPMAAGRCWWSASRAPCSARWTAPGRMRRGRGRAAAEATGDAARRGAAAARSRTALDAYLETVKRFVASCGVYGRENHRRSPTWPPPSTKSSSRSTCRTTRWPPATRSAGVLQIELTRKQQLLELPDAASRLSAELDLLRREARLLSDGAMPPGGRRPPLQPQLSPIAMTPLGRRAALLCAAAADPAALRGPDPLASGSDLQPDGRASPSSPSCRPIGSEPPPSASPDRGHVHRGQRGDTLCRPSRGPGHDRAAQLQAGTRTATRRWSRTRTSSRPGWILIVGGDPSVTPGPGSHATTATPAPTPPPSARAAAPAIGWRLAARRPSTPSPAPVAPWRSPSTWAGGWIRRRHPELPGRHGVAPRSSRPAPWRRPTHGREIMAIVRAHPELFEIGNHTMHHCDLVRGGGGSPTTAPCAGGPPTGRLHPPRADRRGGHPGGADRPAAGALLAPAVRVDQPGADLQACGIGRLHQDLHVGHRHGRLEADLRGRSDGAADRDQGDHRRPRAGRTC